MSAESATHSRVAESVGSRDIDRPSGHRSAKWERGHRTCYLPQWGFAIGANNALATDAVVRSEVEEPTKNTAQRSKTPHNYNMRMRTNGCTQRTKKNNLRCN